MLQIKDVKLKGSAESLYRAETPLVWVHYHFVWVSCRAGGHCVWSPICSPFLNLLTARACLQPASPAAAFMAFPAPDRHETMLSDGFGGITEPRLCRLQSAAGGLTPGIPSLRYHQAALKYIFH